MLAIAETTTTVAPIVVEVNENRLGLIVSVAAVIVILAIGVLTLWQGRALRRIQTREHQWEQRDRTSAHVEVTQQREQTVEGGGGRDVHYQTIDWLRLRNTGLAIAKNVTWSYNTRRLSDVNDLTQLDELHPGEHYDLYIIGRTFGDSEAVVFTVEWTDERGRQSKKTVLNA